MVCDLGTNLCDPPPLPLGYRMVAFHDDTIADHAKVKYESFADGLDGFVFQCLSRHEGCLRLMREISNRRSFCAAATWLVQSTHHRDGTADDDDQERDQPIDGGTAVGTVQGLILDGVGCIQNLGIHPSHRRRRLGSVLMYHAANGFRSHGVKQMQLEVTADNVDAVRLYQRLGFAVQEVVYKAAEVAGSECG